MLRAAGVERVGHETRIVDCGECNAVARQRHHVELGVLHDLQHGLVFEDGLEQIQGLAHGNLRYDVAAEIESVAGTMCQRHISGVSRHQRERHADQLALHRIGRIELHPEGEMTLIARRVEQVGETRGLGHRLVIGAVEGHGLELAGALDRKLCRRAALGLALRLDGWSAWAAPQRMIVIVLLLPLRRGRWRHALRQLGAKPLGDPANQRGEFELAQEADQRLGVGCAHGGLGKLDVERHVRVENDQGLGQPRLVGESDQALTPLVLLDLGCSRRAASRDRRTR